MTDSLAHLKTGVWATGEKIIVPQRLDDRLRDFGLIPGTRVQCRYRSPGNHVTALEFRGTVVALRTGDLEKVRVTVL